MNKRAIGRTFIASMKYAAGSFLVGFFFVGCEPANIVTFRGVPPLACPNTLIGLEWEVTGADSVAIVADPPTGETLPTGLPVAPGLNGFLFRVGRTDTTYTLTARRTGAPDRSASVVVHIVPDPYVLPLDLGYDCDRGAWTREGLGEREYSNALMVQGIHNHETFGITIAHGGATILLIPPGGEGAFDGPMALVSGGVWRAFREGGSLFVPCPEPGTTQMPGQTPTPPPIHITVTSTCPRP
jgi:hypothetical protein